MSGSIPGQAPDVRATVPRPFSESAPQDLHALVDPRWGDAGDDIASPERKSLLSIAGSLLVEVSLPKLLFAATALLLLPAVLLGIAPLVATAWLTNISRYLFRLTEIGAALTAIALLAVATIGWRPLFRLAELNFWSLNAMAVQPVYALFRETVKHLAELLLRPASTAKRARVRAASSAVAGAMLCGLAV